MNLVNICPGVFMEFKWDKEKAIHLDDQDKFVNDVRSKVSEALLALGINK